MESREHVLGRGVGQFDEEELGEDRGCAEVLEGAARFPGPTWVGAVDGLNHYGFTDDASEADLASDGVAGRPVAEARPDALAVIDAFLDHTLVRQDPEPFDGVFANVEELAP